MTFMTLTDCCRLLAIDPKTFRRWLAAAQLEVRPHPTDGRSKGLPLEQLEHLASAHRRTLIPLSAQPHTCPPTSKPEQASALPESELLSGLLAQLSTLQEQVARLSHQLELRLSPESPDPAPPPALEDSAALACQPAVRPSASTQQETVEEARLRPPAQVLPLVEYGREGHYVVICPVQGRLSFEPDSPEWFAWLESRSSFRGCRDKRAASRRIGSATAYPTPSGEPIARSAIGPTISGWPIRSA
jgi:hypothetical protein